MGSIKGEWALGGQGWGQGGQQIPTAGTHTVPTAVGVRTGVAVTSCQKGSWHTMGTSSPASQARSRWYRVPVQEQLL